jgi:hypothetical protein
VSIDPAIDRLLDDEMNSFMILLNSMQPVVQGALAFVMSDDMGQMSTRFTTSADCDTSRGNMAVGLMDIATKILNCQYGDDV